MAKKTKPKAPVSPTPPSNTPPPAGGLDIKVNEFGQIVRNFDLDKLNQFLNENVPDKKFTTED